MSYNYTHLDILQYQDVTYISNSLHDYFMTNFMLSFMIGFLIGCLIGLNNYLLYNYLKKKTE